MRILALPVFGKSVLGYAPFEMVRSWCMSNLEEFSDLFVEMVLPTPDDQIKYDVVRVLEYVEHPRLRTHFVPALRSGINEWAMMTRDLYELLNQTRTSIFYDAIFSTRRGIQPVLKKVLKPKTERFVVEVPIFTASPNVILLPEYDRLRSHHYNYFGEDEALADTAGYLTDFMMFLTATEKRLALRNCKHFLSPAMVRRVESSSIVSCVGGLECDRIDAAAKKKREDKRVCFGWGGRFDAQKGFKDMLEMASKVRSAGYDIKVVFTTAEREPELLAESAPKYPFVEFYPGTSKQEFQAKLGEWDITICLSTVEGSGLAYQEMLYGGALMVFLDSDFAREITPPGYPFIAKKSELLTTLLYMVKNCSELRKEWIPKAQSFLREKFEYKKEHGECYRWLRDRTEDWYKQRNNFSTGSMPALVKQSLVGCGDGADFPAVCTHMTELSESGRQFGRRGDMISSFYLRTMMMAVGFKDLCDGPIPRFVEEKPFSF